MISSGSGFNIKGLQKGHLRYNVDDGMTYQYIGGSLQDISSWRVVFGSEAYGQFVNLVGAVPTNANPYLVPFVAQEVRGMSFDGSTITIEEKGIYVVVDGVQCDKTAGAGGAHFLDMWL